MMEANSQYDVLYITQEEFGQIKNENHQNAGAPYSIDPTTIVIQVKLVKEWATISRPSFFQILHLYPILNTNFSKYFNWNTRLYHQFLS